MLWRRRPWWSALALLVVSLAGVRARADVPGDCDADGKVTADEVQRVAEMVLGTEAPGCGADANGDGRVSVDELQKVVTAYLAGAPPSEYDPQPVVPGTTSEESTGLSTIPGQPGSVSLGDGTRLDVPAVASSVAVSLGRATNTLDLASAGQQASGSMRVVTYTGDLALKELVPLITIPAAEAGTLKAVNIARVGDVTLGGTVLRDRVLFLPVERDASGNLTARDVFLRRAPPISSKGPLAGTSTTVRYAVSTYQGNLNWARPPLLVRMVPDGSSPAARKPLRNLPSLDQTEIQRKPIKNVVVLVHGHNEAEGVGYSLPEVGYPWFFTYKRDVWTGMYRDLLAKYPEYADCTAFYEYVYPSYRPVFGGSEALGTDLARQLQDEPRLKALKQKLNLFVVAHSMGGLVSRAAINQLSSGFLDHLEKLVTWGSPHHGSPAITLRYLLTSGYNLDISGMCGLVPSLEMLNEREFYRNAVQSLAADTPGERDLRWDNYKPLDLEGAGWRRNVWQLADDARYDPARNPDLYNERLRTFNQGDTLRLSGKYAAFYGITTRLATLDWSCSGLNAFRKQPAIAQGNALIRWLYNNPDVLSAYPGTPPVKANDGAVPVDSAVGLGVISAFQTWNLGDVDHEQFFGSSASYTETFTYETLKLRDTATKRCDCPTATVTKVERTAPTAQLAGKLTWPADARPGARVTGIALARGPAETRTVTPARTKSVSDDGAFTATFDDPVLDPAGQTTQVLVQLADGSEVAAPVSYVTLSPLTATVAPGATQAFTASVTGSTDAGVVWSVAEGAPGGSVDASGVYRAPAQEGTYHVVAASRADTTRTARATVTVGVPQVTVTVSPSAVTLPPGGTQRFTATVTGTTNTAVTWSIFESGDVGTIAADGTYTAPSRTGTFRIDATSVADPRKSGSATVTVADSPFKSLYLMVRAYATYTPPWACHGVSFDCWFDLGGNCGAPGSFANDTFSCQWNEPGGKGNATVKLSPDRSRVVSFRFESENVNEREVVAGVDVPSWTYPGRLASFQLKGDVTCAHITEAVHVTKDHAGTTVTLSGYSCRPGDPFPFMEIGLW